MLRRLAILLIILTMSTIPMRLSATNSIQPLGSILFEDHGYAKKCFVQSDIAQLATRLKLQELLPKNIQFMSDEEILALIKYFYGINELIDHMSGSDARQLLEMCFYDMLGGYLKHIILPMTKYSFYAGNVTYSVAQNVFNLYERCKESLNTNGNSWSDPITDFSQFSINVEPLDIPQPSDEEVVKTCANLAMNQNDDDNEEDMLVALPKIETAADENLSTIWLPLRRKHIFNINSRTSAFILFRYYVMVTQCFRYQGINQSIFNRKLKVWISENVIPYLDNDQLYPAFGAILRIMETIRDQNEKIYQGSKEKKRKGHRIDVLSLVNSEIDGKKYEFDFKDRDFIWWCYAIGLAAVLTFLIILVIFLICRFCCKRKGANKKDPNVKKSSSVTQKLSNILKGSTHRPEPDEYYEYKKVSQGDRRPKVLQFENEKKKGFFKKKSKKTKEQISLPNPFASDSGEEIILHESAPSISPSTSSYGSRVQRQNISGETDSVADLAAKNLSRPSKFYQRRSRSKSPKKRNP